MHAIVHLFVSRSSEAFQKMGQSNRKGKTLGLGLTACTCTDHYHASSFIKIVQQWIANKHVTIFHVLFFLL